jgi:UDP-glucose 4-epimerase
MTTNRILVTGATGFVGRHLVPRLRAEGRPLTLAVRRIDACPRAWIEDKDIDVVETGDIDKSSNLGKAFSDVAGVAHLAGLTEARTLTGEDEEAQFYRHNVAATRKLVDAAIAHKVRTFVHLSSLFAATGNVASERLDDASEEKPSTAYGRSKLQAEECVATLSGKGICAISLRLPLVIGPDAKGNWAALQKLAATGLPLPFGAIRNRRSLIGVSSAADAIAHVVTRTWPATASGAYFIADGAVSTAEIVTELRHGMGLGARLVPVPPAILAIGAGLINQRRRMASLLGNCEVDDTRFRQTFAYQSEYDLKETISRSGARGSPATQANFEQ